MDKAEPQEISPQTLAVEFLTEIHASGKYRRDLVERLANLASSDHADILKAATTAIFASLVEKLADSFDPKAVTLYNRLFAQLIDFCRKTPPGAGLDRELAGFGLLSEESVMARAERLRHVRRLRLSEEEKQRIKRAVILSRVTIGADVAVTSVIIERLKKEFANAEIVLLGGAKTVELFGGDARLRFAEIQYQRAGTLTDRLSSWLDVLRSVRELLADLRKDEYLIADPDSRLTQLGLLPLVQETVYDQQNASAQASIAISQNTKARITGNLIFFPSREFGSLTHHTISELTSMWLNAVFDNEENTLPRLSLKQADCALAKALVERMRQGNRRPIVAINFGVGENPAKRLSEDFEEQLLLRLLHSGVKVIFDKGFGTEESKRAEAVLAAAQNASDPGRRIKVLEVDEASLQGLLNEETVTTPVDDPAGSNNLMNREGVSGADVVVWQGRIGLLAGLIAESDLYIGYDSAGQHIAAALQVPCVDVFAGFSSPRMLDRWRPTGAAEICTIGVDTLRGDSNNEAILEDVLLFAEDFIRLHPG